VKPSVIVPLLLALAPIAQARAATIFVTRTEDSGSSGSLRWAIEEANRLPGHDTIRFRTKGHMAIRPLSDLPWVQCPATINGDIGVPWHEVELDGSASGTSLIGLELHGQGCLVRHLAINRFGIGLWLGGTGNHRIEASFVGTDWSGKYEKGNYRGIHVDSPGNTILGNLISGNELGVSIFRFGANRIEGNMIGPDVRGLEFAATGRVWQSTSVLINDSSKNEVRGNVIAGQYGVYVGYGRDNVIVGNVIGADPSGKLPVGNLIDGISISGHGNQVGGLGPADGNRVAIRSPHATGIVVSSGAGNTFRANLVYGFDVPIQPIVLLHPANRSQPAPVLESAGNDGSHIEIAGSLRAERDQHYEIDFYSTPFVLESGPCEARRYLGSVGVLTDATGLASFTFDAGREPAPGEFVTASATSSTYGDTSELALCREVF
jgi:parallel beta-helix repeat protein